MKGRLPLPSVLVFDLDDTLYAEADYVRSGFAAVGSWLTVERGIPGLAEAAWELHLAGVRGNVFDLALQGLGHTAESGLIAAMVEVYRSHEPQIEPDPALPRIFALCKAREIPLCMITDGPPLSQRAKIRALGIEGWFRHIRCTGDWGRDYWKPHPRAFAEVEALLPQLEAAQFMYVGDNPAKDFAAPRARGWRTLRLRRAGGLHENVEPKDEASAPDGEIGGLAELADSQS